jgi:hypothetical protein
MSFSVLPKRKYPGEQAQKPSLHTHFIRAPIGVASFRPVANPQTIAAVSLFN